MKPTNNVLQILSDDLSSQPQISTANNIFPTFVAISITSCVAILATIFLFRNYNTLWTGNKTTKFIESLLHLFSNFQQLELDVVCNSAAGVGNK